MTRGRRLGPRIECAPRPAIARRGPSSTRGLASTIAVCLVASLRAAWAADDGAPDATPVEDRAFHWQFTNVTQHHPGFGAPYSGPNSLDPHASTEETTDLTAFAGMRLWRGAELWVNPEVDEGFGFDKTVGLAGFSSGEAYKVGAAAPYLRLPRLFVRQTFALGGDTTAIDRGANRLGGVGTRDSLTLTVGKFSVVDVFDANRYAHDPRGDFMNWALIDAGAFDYAADSWGFTYGGAAELALGDWTTRLGVFQMSRVPNGKIVAVDFGQYSAVAEVEHRHRLFDRGGAAKLLAFVNRAAMADYRDAVALAQTTGTTPDVADVRRRRSRAGFSLNVEQEIADGAGLFVRASANDGRREAYEFTEINRSLAGGVSIDGRRWGRGGDTLGIAGVVDALSGAARDYFAAGGVGILIGDGRLNDAAERIVETYYAFALPGKATLTFDYQRIANPAYNRDRGPVSVYSLRLHIDR